MNQKLGVTGWILVLTMITACNGNANSNNNSGQNMGNNSDSQGNQTLTLKSKVDANLTDAKGFLIGPTLTKNIEGLYLINGDDSTAQIMLTADPSVQAKPLAIFNTPKFVLVNYDRWNWPRLSYQGQSCTLVLARKSDGAVFCADAQLQCQNGSQCHDEMVQTDESGDLIYINSGVALEKLSMKDPDHPTLTTMLTQSIDGWVDGLAVNASGDALISFTPKDGSARNLRVYTSSGSFTNIASGWGKGCVTAGAGITKNSFFYIDTEDSLVKQLDRSGNSYKQSVYYNFSWYIADATHLEWIDSTGDAVLARTADRVFVRQKGTNKVVDLINPEKKPVVYTIDETNLVVRIKAADQVLIIEGKDSYGNGMLLGYSYGEQKIETIVPAGDYVFSALGVSSDGGITFSGQRGSDGARIIAEIAVDSNQVEIKSTNFGEINQILRML